MRDNNIKPFIATLYNVPSGPDLSESLIFHYDVNKFGTCITFLQIFCTVLFSANKQNTATSAHSAQIKYYVLPKKS